VEKKFEIIRRQIKDLAYELKCHYKSNKIQVPFDYDRISGATDALLEAKLASEAYERVFKDDPGVKVLTSYGFLQALFVLMNATNEAREAVNLESIKFFDSELKDILLARNRISGHPAWSYLNSRKKIGGTSSFHNFSNNDPTKICVTVYATRPPDQNEENFLAYKSMDVSELRSRTKKFIEPFLNDVLVKLKTLE